MSTPTYNDRTLQWLSTPVFNDGPFTYATQQPTQTSNDANASMENEQESSSIPQVSKTFEFAVPLPKSKLVVDDRAGYEYSDDEEDENEHADAIEDRLINEIMFQSIPDWVHELDAEKFTPIRLNLEEHLTGKTIPELREILRELTKS